MSAGIITKKFLKMKIIKFIILIFFNGTKIEANWQAIIENEAKAILNPPLTKELLIAHAKLHGSASVG